MRTTITAGKTKQALTFNCPVCFQVWASTDWVFVKESIDVKPGLATNDTCQNCQNICNSLVTIGQGFAHVT